MAPAALATASASATSNACVTTRPASALLAAASAGASRSHSAMAAPPAARRRATARPMPAAPPVMTALRLRKLELVHLGPVRDRVCRFANDWHGAPIEAAKNEGVDRASLRGEQRRSGAQGTRSLRAAAKTTLRFVAKPRRAPDRLRFAPRPGSVFARNRSLADMVRTGCLLIYDQHEIDEQQEDADHGDDRHDGGERILRLTLEHREFIGELGDLVVARQRFRDRAVFLERRALRRVGNADRRDDEKLVTCSDRYRLLSQKLVRTPPLSRSPCPAFRARTRSPAMHEELGGSRRRSRP